MHVTSDLTKKKRTFSALAVNNSVMVPTKKSHNFEDSSVLTFEIL